MTQTRNSFIQRTFTFRSTSLHKPTILLILLTQDPLTNRFPFHLTSILKNHRFIHLFNQRIIFTQRKGREKFASFQKYYIFVKIRCFKCILFFYLNYTYSKVRINRSMKNFLFPRSRIFEIIVPARYS